MVGRCLGGLGLAPVLVSREVSQGEDCQFPNALGHIRVIVLCHLRKGGCHSHLNCASHMWQTEGPPSCWKQNRKAHREELVSSRMLRAH